MLLDRLTKSETSESFATTNVELHIRFLQSEHEQMRLKAAGMLVQIGEPAVAPLVNNLGDSRKHVWMLAAGALVKIGEPAVRLLIEALRDENEQVRMLAVGALGRIAHPRAVQPLIYGMRQEHELVRELVVWALVKIGQPAVGPLIAALRDNSASVKAAAAKALGDIGDPLAIGPLQALQRTEDSEVRCAVEAALMKLKYSSKGIAAPV